VDDQLRERGVSLADVAEESKVCKNSEDRKASSMTTNAQFAAVGNSALWTGRILSGLIVLFMLFDAGVKLAKAAPAVEGMVRLGFPAWELVPIGIVALICLILYVIPRTAVLGAILLTGYLGGATATQVRMQDPWFVMPVILGIIAWGGLYFRNETLRRLVLITR
jgi:hypothetical protein